MNVQMMLLYSINKNWSPPVNWGADKIISLPVLVIHRPQFETNMYAF